MIDTITDRSNLYENLEDLDIIKDLTEGEPLYPPYTTYHED